MFPGDRVDTHLRPGPPGRFQRIAIARRTARSARPAGRPAHGSDSSPNAVGRDGGRRVSRDSYADGDAVAERRRRASRTRPPGRSTRSGPRRRPAGSAALPCRPAQGQVTVTSTSDPRQRRQGRTAIDASPVCHASNSAPRPASRPGAQVVRVLLNVHERRHVLVRPIGMSQRASSARASSAGPSAPTAGRAAAPAG